jgi:hypothetical protein
LALRCILVLFGLAIAAGLAELGLRLTRPVDTRYLLPLPYKQAELERIKAEDSYIRFDAQLGWAPTPSISRESWGVTYRANGAGIRAEREYPLQPAGRRLAAFGDSFTYCEEVDQSECWTAVLEERLQRIEVLNFGVPGYGPDQAWLRYERDGRPYQPCGVLIGYMVENINRVVNRFRPFYEPNTGLALAKPRFRLSGDGLQLLPSPAASPDDLLDPAWVERELGPHDAWYFPGTFVANPLDRSLLVRLARTAAYRRGPKDLEFTRDWADQLARAYRDRGESYQVAGRVLLEFARTVQRDGATPVVVVFGTRVDVERLAADRHAPKAYQPLLDWLRREQIPTLDVTDALANEGRRSGVDRLIENHFTGRGNRIAAEALSRDVPALVAPTCRDARSG